MACYNWRSSFHSRTTYNKFFISTRCNIVYCGIGFNFSLFRCGTALLNYRKSQCFTFNRKRSSLDRKIWKQTPTLEDKVITAMVIRPFDDPTRCAQSVVADLRRSGMSSFGSPPMYTIWFISYRLAAISKGDFSTSRCGGGRVRRKVGVRDGPIR